MSIIGGNVWVQGDTMMVNAGNKLLVLPKMDKKYLAKVEESLRRMKYFDPKRGFRRSEAALPQNEKDIASINLYNKERRLVRSWMPIVDYILASEQDKPDFLVEMFIQQFDVQSVPEDVLPVYKQEIEKLANLLIKYM